MQGHTGAKSFLDIFLLYIDGMVVESFGVAWVERLYLLQFSKS